MLALLATRGCPALVMEDAPDEEGENAARKFHRLVETHHVRTFAVLWPKGCRMNGLDVELGMLLKAIVDGKLDPRDVHLIAQADHLAILPEEGTWSLGEKGNRTRYYEALIDEGCTIHRFTTLTDLEANIAAVVIDHHQRHLLQVGEREFVGRTAVRLKAQAPVAGPARKPRIRT